MDGVNTGENSRTEDSHPLDEPLTTEKITLQFFEEVYSDIQKVCWSLFESIS